MHEDSRLEVPHAPGEQRRRISRVDQSPADRSRRHSTVKSALRQRRGYRIWFRQGHLQKVCALDSVRGV